MDIERLKELKSWVSDLRKFGVSEGNEIIVLIDEAIARQSATSEDVEEAIDILQAIRPSETKTTGCHYCRGIESHGIVAVKTVIDEYLNVVPGYDTPYNYCPNCGRKIK